MADSADLVVLGAYLGSGNKGRSKQTTKLVELPKSRVLNKNCQLNPLYFSLGTVKSKKEGSHSQLNVKT